MSEESSKVHRNWPCPVCSGSPDDVCSCEQLGLAPTIAEAERALKRGEVSTLDEVVQPPPSVPAGADVAAVLDGLVEKLTTLNAELIAEGWVDMAHGVRWAQRLVERALAVTGARAADGENPWTAQSEDLLPCVDDDEETGGEPTFEMIERGAGAAYEHQRVVADPMDHGPWENVKKRRWAYQQDSYKRWYEIAEAVLLAAAPPTPSAPGVAELLAECARRLIDQEDEPKYRAVMPVDEIVRLLVPGGADGEGM